MLKSRVNDKDHEVSIHDDIIHIDGQPVSWDMVRISKSHYHLLHNHQSYRIELVKVDLTTKSIIIKLNGKLVPVTIKNQLDLLLERMGMAGIQSNRMNAVRAPMPGLVIDVKVSAGDVVKAGDPLIILEAMKMENVIKSNGDGTVKNVVAKKGDSVEKNQVLIAF
jgi:biotin carboxyl carrier protein